ncbi:NAD(P)-dependent oxidoreductase [Candidatus Saccharibacteria bacterium]|nr:NAD(P)-dependent oxidoreductase [Candidatus Saccharibacteria bacterium]
MNDSNTLIVGANGQLGRALQVIYPKAKKTDSAKLDITSAEALKKFDWDGIEIIINAAAYTNVDGAETPEGQASAWKVNDEGVANLVNVATEKDLLLVHISTAYVFDGSKKTYKESEPPSPLSVYGKSKAAGDEKVAKVTKHYIVRTDSVIGEGKNFVRTMLDLGKKGVGPKVVADQTIRPAFTTEVAKAIKFLIDAPAEYGTYNVTNEGDPVSWADFTRAIFEEASIDQKVTNITFKEYFASKPGVAPRPLNSILDLTKIESIGFKPRDWRQDLKDYIKKELSK